MSRIARCAWRKSAACLLVALCGFAACDEDLQEPGMAAAGAAGGSTGCRSCAPAAGEGGTASRPEGAAGSGGNSASATGGESGLSGGANSSGASAAGAGGETPWTPSSEGGAVSGEGAAGVEGEGAAGTSGDGTRDFEGGGEFFCKGANFPPLKHLCFPPSSDPSYAFQMSLFTQEEITMEPGDLRVTAINVHGVAVGTQNTRFTTYDESTGSGTICSANRAFAFRDGVFTDLAPTGDQDSRAIDINAHGVIVGTANRVPVLWRDGEIRQLNGPFSLDSEPIAINDRGQILILTSQKSELWSPRGVQLIGEKLYARDLNNAGQVVGDDLESGIAFLWQDGLVRSLPPLEGHRWSSALAINDAGVVVGSSSSNDGTERRSVIWEDGVPREFISLLGADWKFISINNQGVYLLFHDESVFTYSEGELQRVTDNFDSDMSINDSGIVLGRYVWSPSCYDKCCESAEQ